MARLNEQQSGSSEAIEALKKRYLRQNREIARANSVQSVRIRTLESETTRLLSENIGLREEVIRLQVQLNRRDKNRQIVENVQAVRKKMLDKAAEFIQLAEELDNPGGSPAQKAGEDDSPIMESRLMRDSYIPGELPEGYLPAISEDTRSRRSSLHDAHRRRSSFNFDEIQLPPQLPDFFAPSDSDPEPENDFPISYVESRRPTRRRRISSHAQEPELPVKEAISCDPTKPIRRFTELDQSPVALSSPELEYRFSKVSERAANTARLQMEEALQRGRSPKETADEVGDHAEEVEQPPSPSERPAMKMHSRSSSSSSISSTSRKALGPKSTNSDPINSPIKIASRKDGDNDLHKVKMEQPPPVSTKVYRGPSIRDRDTPPPDSESAISTGRTSRRARSTVSYAEPSLRQKMRREEPGFVDAVRGRKGSVTPDPELRSTLKKKPSASKIKVKREQEGDDEDNAQWLNLPVVPKFPNEEMEPIKQLREEETKNLKHDEEDSLPPNVMTHRRRRTSSLILAAPETEAPTELNEVVTEDKRSENVKRRSRSDSIERVSPELQQKRRTTITTNEVKKASRVKSDSSIGPEAGKKTHARRRSMML
ncbi:hypothetical protein EDC01DRAFT_201059 [Geopyxis carbonaria]|nr:hypothetical protein EDC01DRAFT_201059 [Geopyxis carbonaria]